MKTKKRTCIINIIFFLFYSTHKQINRKNKNIKSKIATASGNPAIDCKFEVYKKTILCYNSFNRSFITFRSQIVFSFSTALILFMLLLSVLFDKKKLRKKICRKRHTLLRYIRPFSQVIFYKIIYFTGLSLMKCDQLQTSQWQHWFYSLRTYFCGK